MAASWFIAIAGPMGSGKSTLAFGLSRILDFRYLPESPRGVEYLQDLFRDRGRWAFETQLSFLCHKATQLDSALSHQDGVVLDRTLHEDIDVFGRHFHDSGDIDQRAYTTYLTLASHFTTVIRPPDLVVYCNCSRATLRARIRSRGREYQRHYPKGHLTEIFDLYDLWSENYSGGPLYSIDGDEYDWRQADTLRQIAIDVSHIFQPTVRQMYLFETTPSPNGNSGEVESILVPVRRYHDGSRTDTRPPLAMGTDSETSLLPRVYVAAPFTGRAEIGLASRREANLFELSPAHGKILRGKYRNALLAVARLMTTLGMSVLLPHRDVNRWGNRALEPADVVRQCTEHVRRCDLFVGIPGESHGSHYEFGLALGLGKPCLILRCDEIASSFIARGITASSDNVLVLRCRRMRDLHTILSSPEATDFMARFVPIHIPTPDDSPDDQASAS